MGKSFPGSEHFYLWRQRVVIDGQCFQWSSVSLGVPQESILDPLLFLIYILMILIGDHVYQIVSFLLMIVLSTEMSILMLTLNSCKMI